jgi:hypothetical protein
LKQQQVKNYAITIYYNCALKYLQLSWCWIGCIAA